MTDEHQPLAKANGTWVIDADVTSESGVTDLSPYGGGTHPTWHIVVDNP